MCGVFQGDKVWGCVGDVCRSARWYLRMAESYGRNVKRCCIEQLIHLAATGEEWIAVVQAWCQSMRFKKRESDGQIKT